MRRGCALRHDEGNVGAVGDGAVVARVHLLQLGGYRGQLVVSVAGLAADRLREHAMLLTSRIDLLAYVYRPQDLFESYNDQRLRRCE